MSEEILFGRNSVMEALKSGRPLNKVMLAKGERLGSVREIAGLAKSQGVVVQEVDVARLEALTQGARHQGVVATVAPVASVEREDILAAAAVKNEPPFVILLDELEDPHNVGAILRTADAAGAHGVIMPKRRSCPLSGAVAKASAGAALYVPVARVGNIVQAMKDLKAKGLWIAGADMAGD
ncbi:MAG: 23S rRNA (guanosine(2251)-2'-O)-methyltransferase RlmB, partial [Negativicutes bacterium]|nr:23S rRNA (guanosine(2251)-2'-O)-methyltransferase RlmB [Negativicutes bacterium]